ncbi:uncharacterized protein LOC119670715 isoform X1 [Teleopsis dalmanni]|uniref:uncharacterized protein LOC119670715 isoform X1 n=1 Tax=Teleopsis dalmanni TaxID=139649 RepID=UPI0018CCC4DA|nr:uncharacterized protein LOC119670715 isoform X1 [Teleopsis dalmanni]
MLRLLNTVALILIVYGVGLTTSLPHPPTTTAPLIAARQTYDTKFDNVNLDELLGQERLLKNYIKCLESTGPCTPDGKMLKGFANFRNSPRGDVNELRQMLGETEVRFRQGNTFFDRQPSRRLEAFGENLRSARSIPQAVFSAEGKEQFDERRGGTGVNNIF